MIPVDLRSERLLLDQLTAADRDLMVEYGELARRVGLDGTAGGAGNTRAGRVV